MNEPKIQCPECHGWLSRVLPAHPQGTGKGFPRLRECLACFCRFETAEVFARVRPRKHSRPPDSATS